MVFLLYGLFVSDLSDAPQRNRLQHLWPLHLILGCVTLDFARHQAVLSLISFTSWAGILKPTQLEPLLRTLLRTLFYCKPIADHLLRTRLQNPFQNLPRTLLSCGNCFPKRALRQPRPSIRPVLFQASADTCI